MTDTAVADFPSNHVFAGFEVTADLDSVVRVECDRRGCRWESEPLVGPNSLIAAVQAAYDHAMEARHDV